MYTVFWFVYDTIGVCWTTIDTYEYGYHIFPKNLSEEAYKLEEQLHTCGQHFKTTTILDNHISNISYLLQNQKVCVLV